MSTTLIFAEILIVGFLALVWFGLMLGALLGIYTVDLSCLKGWETIISVFATALAYTLGVLVDRLSDSMLYKWDDSLRRGIITEGEDEYSVMRLVPASNKDYEGMAKFLSYVRSRIRIARSTVLNIILIVLGVMVYVLFSGASAYYGWNETGIIILTSGFGLILAAGTLYAWKRMTISYYHRLKEANSIIGGLHSEQS